MDINFIEYDFESLKFKLDMKDYVFSKKNKL